MVWCFPAFHGANPFAQPFYLRNCFPIHLSKATSLRLETVNHRLETVNHRLETVNHRLETVNHRLETVNHRLETVNHRLETVNHRLGMLWRARMWRRGSAQMRRRTPVAWWYWLTG